MDTSPEISKNKFLLTISILIILLSGGCNNANIDLVSKDILVYLERKYHKKFDIIEARRWGDFTTVRYFLFVKPVNDEKQVFGIRADYEHMPTIYIYGDGYYRLSDNGNKAVQQVKHILQPYKEYTFELVNSGFDVVNRKKLASFKNYNHQFSINIAIFTDRKPDLTTVLRKITKYFKLNAFCLDISIGVFPPSLYEENRNFRDTVYDLKIKKGIKPTKKIELHLSKKRLMELEKKGFSYFINRPANYTCPNELNPYGIDGRASSLWPKFHW